MTQKNNLTAKAKIMYAIIGIAMVVIVAWIAPTLVGIWSWMSIMDHHNKTYLISHFKDNQTAFYGIRDYVDAIDPEQNVKQLEFYILENDEVFSVKVNGKEESGDSHNIDSWIPADSLLHTTHWTKKDFITVYSKLNELGCTAIKRGEPFTVTFSNNGSDELYHIYKYSVSKTPFLDNPCNYYVLNDHVILEHIYLTEWGGTDCFEDEANYGKGYLVSNFEDNQAAFYSLRDYANSGDLKYNVNQLEFDIDKDRGVFSIKVNGKEQGGDFDNIESWIPSDSLLYATNWAKKDFVTVYSKLHELGCSGIKRGEPFTVIFNNNNGCHELYHMYKYPIAKTSFLNNPCNYYILNDQVILEHIMGWNGTDCFDK